MIKSCKLFFICFCIGFFFPASAEVYMSSSAVPSALSPKDTLDLVVTIQYKGEENVSSPSLPQLKDFDLIHQSMSQNISIINGAVNKEKTYRYTLRPKKEGVFTIEPVTAEIDAKLYKTQPLKVEVSSKIPYKPKKPKPGGGFGKNLRDFFSNPFFDDWDKGSFPSQTMEIQEEDIKLKTNINKKTKIYIGEMLITEWSYLTPLNKIGAVNYELSQTADIEGFWSEPLITPGARLAPSQIQNSYRKQVVQKLALFPIKTGRLNIGSLPVVFYIQTAGFFSSPKAFKKLSPKKTIQVIPLPNNEKPKIFTEAVGDFSVTAQVNKTEVSHQNPLIYKIHFKGKGHPRLIQLPPLNFPESLEVYDTTESQKFSSNNSEKTFEIILIPQKKGKIKIPKFELSTFNPALGVYTLHILPSISINVQYNPSQNKTNDEKYFQSKTQPAQIELQPAAHLSSSFFSADKRQYLWIFVYSLLFLCLAGLLIKNQFFIKKNQKPVDQWIEQTETQIKKHIHQKNWKEAGVELHQLIYLALSESSSADVSLKNLDVLLKHLKPSLRARYESLIRRILSEVEKLSFAPKKEGEELRTKQAVLRIKKEVISLVQKISQG